MKKMLLKEFSGQDISDTVFDYLNYFEASEEASDYYEKVQNYLADNIEVEKVNRSIVICNITKFIEKHQAKINKFMKSVYYEEYTPQKNGVATYKPSKETKYNTDKGETFYYMYFEIFLNDVLNGGLSENDYKELYKTLTGKED